MLAFSLGALLPLLPYLAGLPVLAAPLGITAVALQCGGMFVGRLTGRPVLRSGLRQLALGALAVAVGSLIGGHASSACAAADPSSPAPTRSCGPTMRWWLRLGAGVPRLPCSAARSC